MAKRKITETELSKIIDSLNSHQLNIYAGICEVTSATIKNFKNAYPIHKKLILKNYSLFNATMIELAQLAEDEQ